MLKYFYVQQQTNTQKVANINKIAVLNYVKVLVFLPLCVKMLAKSKYFGLFHDITAMCWYSGVLLGGFVFMQYDKISVFLR